MSKTAQKTLILQHTDMEVPGSLIAWHDSRKRSFEVFKTYLGAPFPAFDSFDDLVVLGGPMNVDQDKAYPFLKEEKRYIADFMNSQSGRYLGICLGAQLLARALGMKVKKNKHLEIGWHEIEKMPHTHAAFTHWPEKSVVFQWHEDSFEVPPTAVPLFRNEACENQGFAYGERAVALQFHPESTENWIFLCLQDHEDHEHHGKPFVQKRKYVETITPTHLASMQAHFFTFLDRFLK